jgi:hypothetical protein
VIDLLVLRGRQDRSKDAEILVFRHQLAVLQRQITRPRFEPDDRAVLRALARVLGRKRWSILLVKPDTILGSTPDNLWVPETRSLCPGSFDPPQVRVCDATSPGKRCKASPAQRRDGNQP